MMTSVNINFHMVAAMSSSIGQISASGLGGGAAHCSSATFDGGIRSNGSMFLMVRGIPAESAFIRCIQMARVSFGVRTFAYTHRGRMSNRSEP